MKTLTVDHYHEKPIFNIDPADEPCGCCGIKKGRTTKTLHREKLITTAGHRALACQ